MKRYVYLQRLERLIPMLRADELDDVEGFMGHAEAGLALDAAARMIIERQRPIYARDLSTCSSNSCPKLTMRHRTISRRWRSS